MTTLDGKVTFTCCPRISYRLVIAVEFIRAALQLTAHVVKLFLKVFVVAALKTIAISALTYFRNYRCPDSNQCRYTISPGLKF